jgi:hypothetical protein
MSTVSNSEHVIDIMDDIDKELHQILKKDYIKTVRQLTGVEISYMKLSNILAIGACIFTGLGSILAFSAGFFKNEYVSFGAGCANVISMILTKTSSYANNQSQYHDAKLKNHLTKDYRFLHNFVRDPFSLRPINEPKMPDPQNPGLDVQNRYQLSPLSPMSSPPRMTHAKKRVIRNKHSNVLPHAGGHISCTDVIGRRIKNINQTSINKKNDISETHDELSETSSPDLNMETHGTNIQRLNTNTHKKTFDSSANEGMPEDDIPNINNIEIVDIYNRLDN